MIEHVSFEEVTEAYFSCRQHKRMKNSALQYELEYERNNYELYLDLNRGTYEIGTSTCFCVTKPKLREVFAADFRDRIVHHLLINRMLYIFENNFIDESYSCRKGKGTLYGVKDIQKQIEKIGKDCWYVQLDVEGFFMSIDKDILWKQLDTMIRREWKYNPDDIDWWMNLLKMVVYHRPEQKCRKSGNIHLFDELPAHKTLFKSNGKGLPIGNLSSQIFANAYMNELDNKLKDMCMGYGRYVDDFVLLDTDRNKLKSAIHVVRDELAKLGLRLNERKTKIQRADKGILFTGYIIKPWGLYIGNSLKKNAIKASNLEANADYLVKSINSYFGFMAYALAYNIKWRMWKNILHRHHNIKLKGNMRCIARKTVEDIIEEEKDGKISLDEMIEELIP